MYTVKQLSELAEISVRTLHYYDEIGLLRPTQVKPNGYRYYDDNALLKLQQILFYREIGLELMQIKEVMERPDFDLVTALRSHREILNEKIARLKKLVSTVDHTIIHLIEGTEMSKKQMFQAFSDEQQKEYEREIRLQYGPDLVKESVRRWNSYASVQKEAIFQEGNEIYTDMIAAIEQGLSPESTEVQAILVRWHNHIRHFYEPPIEVLRGLGDLYNDHPDFKKNFDAMHPDLAQFMREGIVKYVDDLETAEIVRLLSDDDANKRLSR